MALIKNPLSGGGGGGGSISVVNGIIEQYKASSGTIDANTFVEFVNNWSGIEQKSYNVNSGYPVFSAIKINDTKIFTVQYESSHISACIVTISGDTISFGTSTVVDSSAWMSTASPNVSASLIDSISGVYRFIVFYRSYASSSGTDFTRAYARVVSYDGSTISAGSRVSVISSGYYANYPQVDTFGSSVLLGYAYATSNSVSSSSRYVRIANISGSNSISLGTQVSVDTYSTANYVHGVGYISAGRGFVLTTGTYPLTISGTSITVGAALSPVFNKDKIIKIDNEIYLGYEAIRSSSYDQMRFSCRVLDCSGGTFTVGSTFTSDYIQLTGGSSSAGADVISCSITGDKACLFYGVESNNTYNITSATVSISGTNCVFNAAGVLNLTAGSYGTNFFVIPRAATETALGEIILFSSNTVTSSFGFLLGSTEPQTITLATDPSAIQGLTATACTDTTAGSVWVLNTNESE